MSDIIGHCEEKVCLNICIILIVHLDIVVLISRPNYVRFCLWLWIKSELYKRKVDIRDESLARIKDAATRIKAKINSVEPHAIFVHELKSAFRMTVGFWNTCCEL